MYVAICGNTGAGKSTLGKYLPHCLAQFFQVGYIDEKEFHHDYLQEMFDHPRDYAFLIQMNFLLQRTLKVKRLEEQGRIFLLERSISEDYIFAGRHAESGAITGTQFDVYRQFWEQCHTSISQPSGYIYLSCDDPSLLASRVIEGYRANKRKQELPDDELLDFVKDLNIRYEKWFENLPSKKIRIPIITTEMDDSDDFKKVMEFTHECFQGKT